MRSYPAVSCWKFWARTMVVLRGGDLEVGRARGRARGRESKQVEYTMLYYRSRVADGVSQFSVGIIARVLFENRFHFRFMSFHFFPARQCIVAHGRAAAQATAQSSSVKQAMPVL